MMKAMTKIDYDRIDSAMTAAKMEWNVIGPKSWGTQAPGETYRIYNVFVNYSFVDRIARLFLDPKTTKRYFEEQLDGWAKYYFWSKTEREIYVTDAIGNCHSKVDIYQQLKLNWKLFVNYTWSKRKKFVKEYNSCSK